MNFFSLTCFAIVITTAPLVSHAEQLAVRASDGNTFTVEYQADESFSEVLNRIENAMNIDAPDNCLRSFFIDYMAGPPSDKKVRNYYAPATYEESEMIRDIVTSLAKEDWAVLWKKSGKFEQYRKDLDRLHPFRFVSCIFMDDEMRSGVHAVNDRGGKVWKEFTKGLYTTLTEEAEKNNLEPYIDDFAKQLGIEASKIRKPLHAKKWKEFTSVLLKEIPRGGNPDRYNM